FVAYAAALAVVCALVHHAMALRAVDGETITSAWRRGELVARTTGDTPPPLPPGGAIVREKIVAEGPLPFANETILALSIVTARDGVKATLGGKTAYVTPDDLL